MMVLAIAIINQTASRLAPRRSKHQERVGLRTAFVCWSGDATRRSLPWSWHDGAAEKQREQVVVSPRTRWVRGARLVLAKTVSPVTSCWQWCNGHRFSKSAR
jgi:hypothetical protein